MSSSLNVLVYGSVDRGVCDYYRFGMHRQALLAHGVDLRALTTVRYRTGRDHDYLDAADDEDFTLDREQLDWADVLVFRRFYQTKWNCARCPEIAGSQGEVEGHVAASGGAPHVAQPPDPIVRPILAALERNPRLLNGRAIVYEADDNLLDIKNWNGISARIARERDVVERMLRRADLVTTTTPYLAQAFGRYNHAVRVVRNAVDPDAYTPDPDAPPVEGDPRLIYYGGTVRHRDYDIARAAVEKAKALVPSLQRVWIGTRKDGIVGAEDRLVEAMMDETHPVTASVSDFHRLLGNLRPHIGIAPLVGDEFDRAKSELHWLEYSITGAATVASRTMRPGPYDVIRDGVDGFLARGKAEWLDAVTKLARSKDLRTEMAGRARERVLAEYDIRVRAAEWADAYRWAAEHPGRGGTPALYAGWSEDAATVDARAALGHRESLRAAAEADPAALSALRAAAGGEAVCPAGSLVSVLVPVAGSDPVFVERALASIAAQTHAPIEVIAAGPAGFDPTTVSVPAGLAVRWVFFPPVPDAPGRETEPIVLARALTTAAAAATGDWIVPCSPEGELLPEHVATLLEVAKENALEFVYGQSDVDFGEDARLKLGAWPPAPDYVLTLGSELFAAPLLAVAGYDEDAWREGETPGWALWRRLITAGARIASIECSVHRLAPLAAAA